MADAPGPREHRAADVLCRLRAAQAAAVALPAPVPTAVVDRAGQSANPTESRTDVPELTPSRVDEGNEDGGDVATSPVNLADAPADGRSGPVPAAADAPPPDVAAARRARVERAAMPAPEYRDVIDPRSVLTTLVQRLDRMHADMTAAKQAGDAWKTDILDKLAENKKAVDNEFHSLHANFAKLVEDTDDRFQRMDRTVAGIGEMLLPEVRQTTAEQSSLDRVQNRSVPRALRSADDAQDYDHTADVRVDPVHFRSASVERRPYVGVESGRGVRSVPAERRVSRPSGELNVRPTIDMSMPPPPVAPMPGPGQSGTASGISMSDAVKQLEPFYGNSNRQSEVVDVAEFLALHRWFESSRFKLNAAGVPTERHSMILTQKLGGPMCSTFMTRAMAEGWRFNEWPPGLWLQHAVSLFPDAEASMTAKLMSMKFYSSSLVSDLMTFRQRAKYSSWAPILDQNETLYTAIRRKMISAVPDILIRGVAEFQLSLRNEVGFDSFVAAAIHLAQRVQVARKADSAAGIEVVGGPTSRAPAQKRSKTVVGATSGSVAASGDSKRQRVNALDQSQVTAVDDAAARIRKMGDSADEQKQYRAWGSIANDAQFLLEIGHCPVCSYTGAYRGAAEPLQSIGGHKCRRHVNGKSLSLLRDLCKQGRNPNVGLYKSDGPPFGVVRNARSNR